MKHMKGSVLIFAVAAAFAGNVAAGDIDVCMSDIGFTTGGTDVNPLNLTKPQTIDSFDDKGAAISQTGIWRAISVAQNEYAFMNNNKFVDECMVPRNTKGRTVIVAVPVYTAAGNQARLTVDQCSMYQSLGSASEKLWQLKMDDAASQLLALRAKAGTLADARKAKLTEKGRDDIQAAIDTALKCITP